jgi:hypothetical protein
MSDLERARTHLRACQANLAWRRQYWSRDAEPNTDAVLAALSWCWEEQEKARIEYVAFCKEYLRMATGEPSNSGIPTHDRSAIHSPRRGRPATLSASEEVRRNHLY